MSLALAADSQMISVTNATKARLLPTRGAKESVVLGPDLRSQYIACFGLGVGSQMTLSQAWPYLSAALARGASGGRSPCVFD